MEIYANRSGESGVAGYEISDTYIRVQFTTGAVYRYSYASAGRENIETMKRLANEGIGLNSFISTTVRKDYEEREQ